MEGNMSTFLFLPSVHPHPFFFSLLSLPKEMEEKNLLHNNLLLLLIFFLHSWLWCVKPVPLSSFFLSFIYSLSISYSLSYGKTFPLLLLKKSFREREREKDNILREGGREGERRREEKERKNFCSLLSRHLFNTWFLTSLLPNNPSISFFLSLSIISFFLSSFFLFSLLFLFSLEKNESFSKNIFHGESWSRVIPGEREGNKWMRIGERKSKKEKKKK